MAFEMRPILICDSVVGVQNVPFERNGPRLADAGKARARRALAKMKRGKLGCFTRLIAATTHRTHMKFLLGI